MEAVQAVQQILDEVNQAKDARQTSPDFARFIQTLAAASGNSPVAAFCRFLAGVQISLETELSGDSVEAWRRTSSRLAKDRQRLVDAMDVDSQPRRTRQQKPITSVRSRRSPPCRTRRLQFSTTQRSRPSWLVATPPALTDRKAWRSRCRSVLRHLVANLKLRRY